MIPMRLTVNCFVLLCLLVVSDCGRSAPESAQPTLPTYDADNQASASGRTARIDVALANETVKILAEGRDGDKELKIKEVQAAPEKYPPPVFYALSAAFFQKGKKDDAAFWFYAGQVRARFDANRCADETARQAVAVLNEAYGPAINEYTFKNLDKLEAMIPKVIAWDRKTPHKYDHHWINLHGMGAVLKGLGDSDVKGQTSPLSLPEDQWEKIAEETRTDYLKGFRDALAEMKKRR